MDENNGFPMDDVLIGVETYHQKEGEGLVLEGMMEGVCKVNGTIPKKKAWNEKQQ
jgi:hypothetical protein